jgi:hypothetical protein
MRKHDRGSAVADIFISYARPDRELAEGLADELSAQGYSVWWDTSLVPGESFRSRLMAELEAAGAVVVIWTPNSVKSEWVVSEAERAAAQGKLVPTRVETLPILDIPPPFDQKHTVAISQIGSLLDKNRKHSKSQPISTASGVSWWAMRALPAIAILAAAWAWVSIVFTVKADILAGFVDETFKRSLCPDDKYPLPVALRNAGFTRRECAS